MDLESDGPTPKRQNRPKGTGSLQLRGSVWHWKSPSGRRFTTGCHDRVSAEAWVDLHLAEIRRLAEGGREGIVEYLFNNPRKGLASLHGMSYSELERAAIRRPPIYEELEQMLVDDAQARELKSLHCLAARVKYLREAFAGRKATEITTDRITAYVASRRQAGAAVATVNTELFYLSRMLRLAMEAGRLERAPRIRKLKGAHVRQGFLDDEQLEAILARLREELRPPVRFLRLSGWRLREALDLEWRRVDWAAAEIRLETSKTGQPRTLPFASYDPLRELLLEQRAAAERLTATGIISPYVFPVTGGGKMSSRTLQSAWNRARKAAGIPWAVPHDLRRTAVRAMERAGVSRSVAMKVTGHMSESIYRRYAIVDRRDMEEGLARLSESLSPTLKAMAKGIAIVPPSERR